MVCARFAPCVGGIETHVLEVSRRLAQRGFAVTVLTTDGPADAPRFEIRDGFAVERYPTLARVADLHLSTSLARAVEHGGFDVVHVQGIHTLLPFLAIRAASRDRTPSVVTFHTGGHSSRLRSMGRTPQWAILGPTLRRTAHLIAVCEFEQELFVRRTGLPTHRVSVIRNGADPLPVDEATPSTTLGDPLVLSIGRLERYKGHHRVIAAMPPLLARAPGARLVVVGSGPYEHRLRRQVASAGLAGAVTFSAFGSSERAKLGALLTKADVVTLMSDYEAHPVAVMEALALGTPVLTAQGSGLTELGRSGLVRTVPARSAPAELAVAVLAVARGGRAVPRPDLPTWDECTDGLARVYHAVAQ